MRQLIRKHFEDIAGLTGHALIVAGTWGFCGWPAALIVAGAPFAGFWIWGEFRRSRG